MANVVAFSGSTGTFAHCTVALDIAREPAAVSRFESGKPYAIAGRVAGNVVTLVSIARGLRRMAVARDRLKASGQLGLQGLRTQALVEFGFNAEGIPRLARPTTTYSSPGPRRRDQGRGLRARQGVAEYLSQEPFAKVKKRQREASNLNIKAGGSLITEVKKTIERLPGNA